MPGVPSQTDQRNWLQIQESWWSQILDEEEWCADFQSTFFYKKCSDWRKNVTVLYTSTKPGSTRTTPSPSVGLTLLPAKPQGSRCRQEKGAASSSSMQEQNTDLFLTQSSFSNKKNDGDYHNQMTSVKFEEWFRNQLLPNIAPNSVIVMDNAAYHSTQIEKMPTSTWRKRDIKEWLIKKGAQPGDELLKNQLLLLTKQYITGKKYLIDTIAEEAGHRVVRLPPYHC